MSSDTSRGEGPGIAYTGSRSPGEGQPAPSPVIRRATPADIDAVFAIGTAEPAFGVSSAIRFYERCELEEWVAAPKENILLVLEDEDGIAGFLFCKIMSSHWAYLDNFYLRPGNRGRGYGRLFMEALLARLKCQGIAYLSTLIDKEDTFLTGYVTTYGLESEKTYVWMDRFVD
ncbi:GNAT family N-acetyltransferase [Methanoregula sp. UBA64]|jgi:L-amino acid N-acyltransferase YncA|uniref:GNAT family N-acetyltransferase n=1 Tax=Methanoregula sp. UBA64 TaxID=1915554 RepID=UPI0025E507AC|nr:GNAT family N-acetyltransferase [Methanoregula sp. UBA64]